MTISPNRTFALIVGVEKYNAGPKWNLDGPVPDACRYANWFLDQGVPLQNIHVCLSPIEENKDVRPRDGLTIHPATFSAIINIMQILGQCEGDLLWIVWGGHGVSDRRQRRLFCADASERDKANLDLSSLIDALQSTYFKSLPDQIGLFDACANDLDQLRYALKLPAYEFSLGNSRPSRQFFLHASRPGQSAANKSVDKTGQFTQEIFPLLVEAAQRSWPPDMKWVADRLEQRFAELVSQGKARQTPTRFVVDDWNGGHVDLVWGQASREDFRGKLKSSLIDRSIQRSGFFGAFRKQLAAHPSPQAYILYGAKGEGHGTLVDVLVEERINKAIQAKWGLEAGAPARRQVTWPPGARMEVMCAQLKNELIQAFANATFSGPDDSFGPLVSHEPLKSERIVILEHRIAIDAWTDDLGRLIRWYLDEYFHAFPSKDVPSVIVFLRIEYEDHGARPLSRLLGRGIFKKRMVTDLEDIARIRRQGCERVVLEELRPLELDHIEEWFDLNFSGGDAAHREIARSIFKRTGPAEKRTRSFDVVQGALDDWIEKEGAER